MKPRGASIIFVNDDNKVLLFLRDNLPNIKYPNMWDILGGRIEDNETPEEGIKREMREELGIDLFEFELFEQMEFPDRTEYTFWKRENLNIYNIIQTEGQALRWFSQREVALTPLAFGFNETVERFYNKLSEL